MKEEEIKQAVENKIRSTPYQRYSSWTIGITEDPDRRRAEHNNPSFWDHWKADTEAIARSVEEYFLNKGMKGGTGGGDHPTYVYVF